MLGASIVCPGRKEVLPVMPEPIFKQDGQTKNDCERNALKRFLPKFREDHPHLPTVALLDALYANAPVIRDLQREQLSWIIRVKPDGNAFLFQQVEEMSQQGLTDQFEAVGSDGVHRRYRLAKNVPLNESNPDVRVDFLEVSEPHFPKGRRSFTWIVDPRRGLCHTSKVNVVKALGLCPELAEQFMWAGRSRWKIENETFNTLKNQGYQFEHNFGHGHQNLSVVFAMLMMLAFLVDQTQQLCCPQFTAAWKECRSKRALWERMREVFHQFQVPSMQAIYAAMLSKSKPSLQVLKDL